MVAGSELLQGTNLSGPDIAVIVLYFVIVMAFGIWSSLRNRGSLGGYFLAGRNMHWIPVGASLFASNIGTDHFIGLAGSGAANGTGTSSFELNALFVLMLLGWLFLPVYIAAGVFTMPEYLQKRFGKQRIRVYLSVLALLLAVFTKVAPALFAGALFVNQALRLNMYLAIILLLAVAALFTICGGLTAVIWTDFIQTVIMMIGAFILMITAFIEVGGFENVKYKFMRAISNTTIVNFNSTSCGIPPENSLDLIRSVHDPNYPWTGIIFGLTISAVWYWCSDQVIVQRGLAAKNLSHAKGGCILAGYLKILPMWILVLPGMIARILFPDIVGCADPDECNTHCGQRAGCTNIAYPLLVLKLMPSGARGLLLAVMLAALMSSLTSIFNSSSTIFTMDIWKLIRKKATDIELMVVGRVFVIFMVGVGIVWIPIVQDASELFQYIQSVTSFLSPPICAVYVLAIFWPRCNEQGAFWGLMVGLAVGLTRFIWEISYGKFPCAEAHKSQMPDIISKVHYLHFGIMLFGIVLITCVVISLLTKPIDERCLVRLTFWTRKSKAVRIDIDDPEALINAPPVNDEGDYVNGQFNNAYVPDVNEGTTTATMTEVAEVDDDPPPKWYRQALNWVCGIEKTPELTEEQKAELQKRMISLDEESFWRRFWNVQAIVLMTVAIFFFAFFAHLKE